MNALRTIAFVLVIGMAGQLVAQHTPITTQYLFNGLLINPAYAGSRDALTANLTWRKQWVGFDGAPETQVLSVHSPLTGKKLALGLLVTNDGIGISKQTGVMTNYAYRVKLGTGKLSFGIGADFKTGRYEWTAVRTTDEGDAQFAADGPATTRADFSGGAYWYSKKYFVGLSIPTLPRSITINDSSRTNTTSGLAFTQPMLTGGLLLKTGTDFKLKPSFLLRKLGGGPVSGDLSLNVIYQDRFWLGASWRKDDALSLMLEVLPTPQFRVGYAYDLGLGTLAAYHQGSHELMLQYEFGFHVKARDPRFF
ncbi:MAG: type IX secretion system membrane protein PorP/SprF [Flavobacteriales bacterium]|nr:type IX secretion system membrane protein PorP/SprF [Flavobacteriales bacterium]